MSRPRPWAISAYCDKTIARVKAGRGLFGGVRLDAAELVEAFRRIQRRAEAEAREIEVLHLDVDRLRAENSPLCEQLVAYPPLSQELLDSAGHGGPGL